FPSGAGPNLRWHPSGNAILCTADNAIVATVSKPGPLFGKSVALTPGDGPERSRLVISHDGSLVAYNRPVRTLDEAGKPAKDYAGRDFFQIFVTAYPDGNHDGIPDGVD